MRSAILSENRPRKNRMRLKLEMLARTSQTLHPQRTCMSTSMNKTPIELAIRTTLDTIVASSHLCLGTTRQLYDWAAPGPESREIHQQAKTRPSRYHQLVLVKQRFDSLERTGSRDRPSGYGCPDGHDRTQTALPEQQIQLEPANGVRPTTTAAVSDEYSKQVGLQTIRGNAPGSLATGRLKFFIMSTAKLYHNGQRVS
jgi:hypothetical protein